MSRIALGEPEKHEVEVLGEEYLLKPVTRSIIAKIDAAKVDEDAAGPDAVAETYFAVFDIRFASTREKQPKPSTVLRKAWREDRITLRELVDLLDAVADLDRPT